MKRIILAALAASALATSASSEDLTIRFAPPLLFSPGSTARIIHIQPPLGDAERDALKAEDDKWLAFCKPVRRSDHEGIIHLHYAHVGCDRGRSE
jgi:hypothetical protein